MRKRFSITVLAVVLLGVLIWLISPWVNPTGNLSPTPLRSVLPPSSSSPTSTPGVSPSSPTVSLSGAVVATPSPTHPDDPTAMLPTLAWSESPDTRNPNFIKRVRIVKSEFKYPLWRVEETIRPGHQSEPEAVQSRTIMIADHAVVRLNSTEEYAKLQSLSASLGLGIRKVMKMPGCYLVCTPETGTEALPHLLAILGKEKTLIRYAEPDYIVHSQQTTPNDPMFNSLWGMRNSSLPGVDISATRVWDLATGGTQAVVAVIDTGVYYTHADLAANIWSNRAESANGTDDDGNGYIDDVRGWNFYAGNNNPLDDHSHGSHCAGTIGAIGNNGLGVAGVNWRCSILPLKFLDASGSGTDSDAAEAFHYVADLKRRGINIRLTSNSWGGGDYTTTLRDAIQENAALGILCIVAAGNDGANNDQTFFYPASYGESNMIVVAATDSSDALASFSNYGVSSVHLAAPGVSILSTVLYNGYGYKNGTSMATPHVSGVASLLFNTWPDARAEDVRDAILRGIDSIPALASKTITGGRLNAFKSLHTLFRIVHQPLRNTYDTGTDYRVDAEIGPSLLTSATNLFCLWNLDGSTNFSSIPLIHVSNTLYRASIPRQPEGATLYYWLRAASIDGTGVSVPTNAPASLYHFTIVPSRSLTVTGNPSAISTVSPAYGFQISPSGQVFNAFAQAATAPSNGTRWACSGWLGTGSVPSSGATNYVSFTLTNNSTLTWQWRREFALTHFNTLEWSMNTTTWWPEGSTATTLIAAASLQYGLTKFFFAGWNMDGIRQPDASHPAVNPVIINSMTQPHLAQSYYFPENQDTDGDGIPDWWSLFNFGTTNTESNADSDGDGFDNRSEFKDRTNPRDPFSRPEPPAIQHVPLADPQVHPAPFPITATITDNFKVVSATLTWQRNGGLSRSNAMTLNSGALYTATIPFPGTNTDSFIYWIIASDVISSSTNGPHAFTPAYPVAMVSPSSVDAIQLPNTLSNLILTVTNIGTGSLQTDLALLWGGLSNGFEGGVTGWIHSGTGDLWTLSTNRSKSGNTSWYCGNPTTRTYRSSMLARLDTPPLYLAEAARLSFNHWIQCELDGQFWRPGWLPNNCWDGGIVEISTNSGVTFTPITPVGGYPNLISGYEASPWPDMTPCFAGVGAWSKAEFDLSSYTGSVAIIRFHFGSDENTEEEGWYIDDVVVSPFTPPQSWLSLPAPHVTVMPTSTGGVPVTVNTYGIPTGNREAAVLMTSNDPLSPTNAIPIHLRIRSPATLTWLGTPRTYENGTGAITLSNQIWDADGDTCQLEFEWSTSAGGPWSNLWLTAVQASRGNVTFTNATTPSVSSIITQTDSGPVTNSIVSDWDSQHPGNGIVFSPCIVVRGRTWDGLFWNSWVTSQPFMVDNEIPPTPTHFVSLVNRTNSWSMNPVMNLRWDLVQETRGSGVTNYVFGVTTNLMSLTPQGSTTGRTATPPALQDGTNFWAWVCARDGFGNLSLPALFGPCWIDANPPSPAAAVIHLSLSPFGPYLVGVDSIASSWTGFTDAGSGIAGYYFAPTNAGGTSRGSWTTNIQGILTGLATDRTNTFYVWAKDQLGWIGQAASAAFVVLSPGGDWDHDGIQNSAEDTAGTDAASAASKFSVGLSEGQSLTNHEFIIQWPGVTNRHYTITYNDRLTSGSSWQVFPGGSNMVGTVGIMSRTDSTVTLPSRFYRITVIAP